MGKKLRVTVPHSISENLENDRIEFEIEKMGTLGNKILNYYIGKEIKLYSLKSEKGEIIQFNLTEYNNKNFLEGMRKTIKDNHLDSEEILSDAEYVRNIFFNYLGNPKAKRERIVFHEVVKEIEKAIAGKEKIKVSYGDSKDIRVVSPYAVIKGDRDNRLYLLCYCEKNKDYRTYRIAKIIGVYKKFEKRDEMDKRYISNLISNFDPFRTYGHKVVVKMNENGERLLKSAITNRPKELSVEESEKGKIYTFQCNDALGKVYFPQFLDDIEILEPIELREWFKNKFKACSDKYSE